MCIWKEKRNQEKLHNNNRGISFITRKYIIKKF